MQKKTISNKGAKPFIFFLLFVFLLYSPLKPGTVKNPNEKKSVLDSTLLSSFEFRNIGPAMTSGRVSDIAIHPKNRSIWYVAVGSGGVWKTINAGTTWTPIFDNENAYSIGCVAIDPNYPDVIWVGTGENVSGRHVSFGDGIYKSLNGGKTWKNMGLKQSEHISKIIVDPRNSNVVYVAAEGPLWNSGGDRGLYKTTDGGETWTPSLQISKDTGVCDVAFDTKKPDTLYASAYQRRRSVAAFMGGGPESGIYKSTDAGKTWRKLTVGIPSGHKGRIGLAVSPIKPEVVYATIEASDEEKGFYRSSNGGESWEKRNSYTSGGTGCHYYQEIFADPFRFDRVYQMDVWMRVTDDGGKTFRRVGEKSKHSDNHALAFDPTNPDYLLAGCDGGLYESFESGNTWKYFPNLPITQFYKLSLDNALPFYNIHGGAQDNGSQWGPSQTLVLNGIFNSDWINTTGADGYACAIDPENPNIIYSSFQVGELFRYDKRSAEEISIQPKAEPGAEPQRWNWDSPLIISPHSNTRLYYASQRLYRSDDRGESWTVISPDLSRGISRLQQPIMDKTWSVDDLWDLGAMSFFGNITAISESPLKENLIYVGTDDGLIQVTDNGGKQWRKVDGIPGIPPFFFVNDIKASLHDPNTVYAAIDNHKKGDFKPYILKSSDQGRTWTSISGDLPDRTIIWSIAQDHVKPSLLFIGTEFGIYTTLDEGKHWIKLSGGVPTISFRDIEIQKRENDLVGASFGRGFFVLDNYSPLRDIDEKSFAQDAILFPVKKAYLYIRKNILNLPNKSFFGDSFYVAPNPPFGATFTYYLKDSIESDKDQRRELEKTLEKEGKPIPFPGWDTIKKEFIQDAPAIIFTVKDSAGNVVRKFTGPTSQGIHRVVWNLRYLTTDPIEIGPSKYEGDPWDMASEGQLVIPGTYTVSIAKQVDGVLIPLGQPQTVVVESLGLQSLPAKDQKEVREFQAKSAELLRVLMGTRSAMGEARERLQYIKKALTDTPGTDPKLFEEAQEINKKITDLSSKLFGDWTVRMRGEPVSLSVVERITMQHYTTTGITTSNKQNFEIAAKEAETLLEQARQLIDVDLKKLEDKLEAAGAPWTPGRKIPIWKK